jgi:hypothetical protein
VITAPSPCDTVQSLSTESYAATYTVPSDTKHSVSLTSHFGCGLCKCFIPRALSTRTTPSSFDETIAALKGPPAVGSAD